MFNRRIVQFSIGIAPVTGTALLNFKQAFLLGEAIQKSVKDWLKDSQSRLSVVFWHKEYAIYLSF
jgi:hypothetical protein